MIFQFHELTKDHVELKTKKVLNECIFLKLKSFIVRHYVVKI